MFFQSFKQSWADVGWVSQFLGLGASTASTDVFAALFDNPFFLTPGEAPELQTTCERLKGLPAYSSRMTRTAFTFNSYGQSPCGIPFEEHRFASWNPRWCVTLLLDRIVFQTCLEKPICGGQFPEFPSCQNSPKALPSLLNSRFFEVGQCQSWEIRWSMMKRGYFFFQSSCSPSFLVQCWIKQWIWKLRDLEEHDAFNLLE